MGIPEGGSMQSAENGRITTKEVETIVEPADDLKGLFGRVEKCV